MYALPRRPRLEMHEQSDAPHRRSVSGLCKARRCKTETYTPCWGGTLCLVPFGGKVYVPLPYSVKPVEQRVFDLGAGPT